MNNSSSISQVVLNKALIYASSVLSMDEIKLILAFRRSVIEFYNIFWIKKDSYDGFNIPMGTSNSAEVTDIVGIIFSFRWGVSLRNLQIVYIRMTLCSPSRTLQTGN